MQLNEAFKSEWEREAISARKMMERTPFEKFAWKPHERSMDLGGLVRHMANLASFPSKIVSNDFLDIASAPKPQPLASTAELVGLFDMNLNESLKALKNVTNDDLFAEWTLRSGDQVIVSLPRAGALRSIAMNHFIHHRGQLSVYLRLLDIPIPSIYGPSADEQP